MRRTGAEVRSVVVCFDYAAQRPAPWPATARGALAAYVPDASAGAPAADTLVPNDPLPNTATVDGAGAPGAA